MLQGIKFVSHDKVKRAREKNARKEKQKQELLKRQILGDEADNGGGQGKTAPDVLFLNPLVQERLGNVERPADPLQPKVAEEPKRIKRRKRRRKKGESGDTNNTGEKEEEEEELKRMDWMNMPLVLSKGGAEESEGDKRRRLKAQQYEQEIANGTRDKDGMLFGYNAPKVNKPVFSKPEDNEDSNDGKKTKKKTSDVPVKAVNAVGDGGASWRAMIQRRVGERATEKGVSVDEEIKNRFGCSNGMQKALGAGINQAEDDHKEFDMKKWNNQHRHKMREKAIKEAKARGLPTPEKYKRKSNRDNNNNDSKDDNNKDKRGYRNRSRHNNDDDDNDSKNRSGHRSRRQELRERTKRHEEDETEQRRHRSRRHRSHRSKSRSRSRSQEHEHHHRRRRRRTHHSDNDNNNDSHSDKSRDHKSEEPAFKKPRQEPPQASEESKRLKEEKQKQKEARKLEEEKKAKEEADKRRAFLYGGKGKTVKLQKKAPITTHGPQLRPTVINKPVTATTTVTTNETIQSSISAPISIRLPVAFQRATTSQNISNKESENEEPMDIDDKKRNITETSTRTPMMFAPASNSNKSTITANQDDETNSKNASIAASIRPPMTFVSASKPQISAPVSRSIIQPPISISAPISIRPPVPAGISAPIGNIRPPISAPKKLSQLEQMRQEQQGIKPPMKMRSFTSTQEQGREKMRRERPEKANPSGDAIDLLKAQVNKIHHEEESKKKNNGVPEVGGKNISDTANEIARKMVLAELNQDHERAAKLKKGLDMLRNKSAAAAGIYEDKSEAVVTEMVTPIDARGRVIQSLMKPSGQANEATGQARQQLLIERTNELRDMDSTYAHNIMKLGGHFKNNDLQSSASGYDEEDEVDMSLMQDKREKMSEDQRKELDMQRAINAQNAHAKATRKCVFCIGSQKHKPHLEISLGDHNILYVPPPNFLSVNNDHLVIAPLEHIHSYREATEETWNEFLQYKSALVRMFKEQNKVAIFVEVAKNFRFLPHACIHVIGVPQGAESSVELGIRYAFAHTDEKTRNVALTDTVEKGLRRSIPENYPYVHFEWEGKGFLHAIDKERDFSADKAIEVVANTLEVEDEDSESEFEDSFLPEAPKDVIDLEYMKRRRKDRNNESDVKLVQEYAKKFYDFEQELKLSRTS
eukprot:TRINITY_DN277_c5_g1_i1.p1 TRINITY_DN277_c5_g1~~TRINITY_DN277_c5_g1_i1.p1  ORF type:complete len:1152 (-),score=430.87 TRINITY_DN277_c5_g1_i1:115-3570(-)